MDVCDDDFIFSRAFLFYLYSWNCCSQTKLQKIQTKHLFSNLEFIYMLKLGPLSRPEILGFDTQDTGLPDRITGLPGLLDSDYWIIGSDRKLWGLWILFSRKKIYLFKRRIFLVLPRINWIVIINQKVQVSAESVPFKRCQTMSLENRPYFLVGGSLGLIVCIDWRNNSQILDQRQSFGCYEQHLYRIQIELSLGETRN